MRTATRVAQAGAILAAVLVLTAQGRGGVLCGENMPPNVDYDGRFTFVRLRFEPSEESGWGWRRDLKWDHDCPRAEQHFAKILKELTLIDPYLDGGNIFDLDDPKLFQYPIAYLSEPGFWTMNERHVASFRAYLLKGGFAIFDDFQGYHWENFEAQMQRVLPGLRLVELDVTHPVFDSFFHMKNLSFPSPYDNVIPLYYGIYEDNDPKKRLLVVANYNNDIGEYWEWSDEGYVPIELSNEAYKLGVNYVMYAMTH